MTPFCWIMEGNKIPRQEIIFLLDHYKQTICQHLFISKISFFIHICLVMDGTYLFKYKKIYMFVFFFFLYFHIAFPDRLNIIDFCMSKLTYLTFTNESWLSLLSYFDKFVIWFCMKGTTTKIRHMIILKNLKTKLVNCSFIEWKYLLVL